MSDNRSYRDSPAYEAYRTGRDAIAGGDLARAIESLHIAASLQPHAKTYELLGECYLNRGQLSDATLYLAAAAGIGSAQSRARYLLARALILAGDVVGAVQKLTEALDENPTYRMAQTMRDQLLADHPEIRSSLEPNVSDSGGAD